MAGLDVVAVNEAPASPSTPPVHIEPQSYSQLHFRESGLIGAGQTSAAAVPPCV